MHLDMRHLPSDEACWRRRQLGTVVCAYNCACMQRGVVMAPGHAFRLTSGNTHGTHHYYCQTQAFGCLGVTLTMPAPDAFAGSCNDGYHGTA